MELHLITGCLILIALPQLERFGRAVTRGRFGHLIPGTHRWSAHRAFNLQQAIRKVEGKDE